MSSGAQGRKQELAEYEKEYLERLQKQKEGQDTLEIKDEQDFQKIKDGQNLQNLIFNFSKDSKKAEVTTVDYIGHCTFCMMGVSREEMAYKNGHLFHSNCFEQQGKNFPAPNKELQKQNSSAKVELVQLRNLKIRTMESPKPKNTKTKAQKKSKRKTKRKPKRRITKKKRTSRKRKKTKKRISKRKTSKKRRVSKRRTSLKRKKSTRKTKRRGSRRIKRKIRRR